uniref:Uncharacterized protein n=1 Tax=viral metagenome TaxID=1070528 RepID=A0A6C0EL33_9ZZZZ
MSKKESNITADVKNYIKYDDTIKNIEKKLREYRKQRDLYSSNIIDFILDNNKVLKVGNDLLKSKETNTMSPLSQSFIKSSIKDYFTINYNSMSEEDVDKLSNDILNHISISRKTNKKLILKREKNN